MKCLGQNEPMEKPSETRAPAARSESDATSRREWSRPQLVAYGHLAKLTRGTSGAMVEGSGMMVLCL